MLDKLQNLYYGAKLHILEMDNNAKDYMLIAVTNQASSQEEDVNTEHSQDEDENPSDSSDGSKINQNE